MNKCMYCREREVGRTQAPDIWGGGGGGGGEKVICGPLFMNTSDFVENSPHNCFTNNFLYLNKAISRVKISG
jgi:hypothetical protein